MKYTAIYGHLKEESNLNIGDDVFSGTKIGTMGSTGKSNANHVHFGLIEGEYSELFHMSDVRTSEQLLRQASYFIDDQMFGCPIVITSFWGDPRYKSRGAYLFHAGYDVVPVNRHQTHDNFGILWNRTPAGEVLAKGEDPHGYGHYILIGYDT